MDRRQVLTLVGAGASLPLLNALPARAQGAPEKPKLTLGVGGKALLYYLPLTIAERQGHFRDFGLDVEINDFAGGARSLQALVGGSVDLVTGAYEHTIRMQRPALLVADEPCAGLAPDAAGRILKLLLQVRRSGSAVVVLTQDEDLAASLPGPMWRMADGKMSPPDPAEAPE